MNIIDNNQNIFLFDLDGTLVLTDDIYLEIWKTILNSYNIHLTYEIFKNYIQGNDDSSVLNKLLPNKKNEILKDISHLKDDLFKQNINKISIIKGVIDFFVFLKNNNHKIGIVTNCNRVTAELILDHINIRSYIDLLIIGNECNKPKPHSDPYIDAIKYFNSVPSNTIIFEDSKSGILSGKSCNPKCLVGITTNYSEENLLKYGVNITINDYNDMNNIYNSILNYNNLDISLIKEYIQSSLISPNWNIKSIEIDETKLKGGFISDVIKVKIIKENDEIINTVVKLENKNDTFLSKMAIDLGLYEREYYFYENISKYVPIQYPEYYSLIFDKDYNKIGILLKDLFHEKLEINLDLNRENIGISLNIIDSLAKLHSSFWNKNLEHSFKDLKKHNNIMFQPKWKDFLVSKWPFFKNKWNNILSQDKLDKCLYIINNFDDIQNKLSDNNLTLCHGDVKSPNIFYKKLKNNIYEPYFIDWQYIAIGKGVQDLVFFMIESFEIDKINLYKNIFKDYYYIKLLEYGVQNYSLDDYNKDFENSIYYFPFFVAIWFGTVDDDELIDKNFPFFFIQKLFNFF
jgi:beta-phosphoglucomutase-like phosphatase (HAD superfamily)